MEHNTERNTAEEHSMGRNTEHNTVEEHSMGHNMHSMGHNRNSMVHSREHNILLHKAYVVELDLLYFVLVNVVHIDS